MKVALTNTEKSLILGTGPEAVHRQQVATVMHKYLAWVV